MITLGKILIFAMGFCVGAIHGIHIASKKAIEIYEEMEKEHDGRRSKTDIKRL